MSTLSELLAANDTLPERIVAAAMSGDAELLARVQAEQAGMKTRIFAAKVSDLQQRIAAKKAELIEDKAAVQVEGAKSRALQDEERDLRRRIALQARESGLAQSALEQTKADLRQLEIELEQVVAEQAYSADVLARAPVMHSLWHARPPRR